MQQREKQLAVILGGVVGLMAVWMVIKPWYMDPIEQEEAYIALVQTELDGLEAQQRQLISSVQNLAVWKSQSLPPDPKPVGRGRLDATIGQQRYQEWLIDLARKCGFQDPEVTATITRAVQDTYISVPVKIEGEATYSQVCQFIALFEQTDLLHRIESCTLESSNYRGDPLLDVSIVAEGLALQDAPRRTLLFPETKLASAIDLAAKKIQVTDTSGFPSSGQFGIRLGEEQVSVTALKDESWQAIRGQQKTKATAHPAGTPVDLGLKNPLEAGEIAANTHSRWEQLLAENPFTIPPPKGNYSPGLDVASEKTVYVGQWLDLGIRATSFPPSAKAPEFSFVGDVPAGMELRDVDRRPDEKRVIWKPEDSSETTTHRITVEVTREDLEKPLSQTVTINVIKPNTPPEIASIPSQVVYSGQEFSLNIKAEDRDAGQRISYSLGGNNPQGLELDATTGQLTWVPPGPVMDLQTELEVIATDSGSPSRSTSVKIPVQVKADIASFTRFVGSLPASKESEAWLFDRWNKKDVVIKIGETVTVADITAKLVSVESEELIFERDGGLWTLNLGQDLRQMTPEKEPTDQTTAGK